MAPRIDTTPHIPLALPEDDHGVQTNNAANREPPSETTSAEKGRGKKAPGKPKDRIDYDPGYPSYYYLLKRPPKQGDPSGRTIYSGPFDTTPKLPNKEEAPLTTPKRLGTRAPGQKRTSGQAEAKGRKHASKLPAAERAERRRVTHPSDGVGFAYGSAHLDRAAALRRFKGLSPEQTAVLLSAGGRVTIIGGASGTGNASFNKDLAMKRAQALKTFLRQMGAQCQIRYEVRCAPPSGKDDARARTVHLRYDTSVAEANRRLTQGITGDATLPAKGARQKAVTTLRTAAHGRATASKPGLVSPQSLPKAVRDRATWLAQTTGPIGPDFHRSVAGQSNFVQAALGKLSPSDTKKLFPKAERRKLIEQASVHACLDRIKDTLSVAFKQGRARLDKLIGSSSERAAIWKRAGTASQRKKLLTSLGVTPETAQALSARSEVPDSELLTALRSAKTRVSDAESDALGRLGTAIAHPAGVIALLKNIPGHVKQAKKALDIRKGSFADQALDKLVMRGEDDKKLFGYYQFAFGVLASVISGGILSAGVAVAAVTAAGTAAVMGAPSLVAQAGRPNKAQLLDALKISDGKALARAKQRFKSALTGYLLGIAGSAAGGAAGKYLGHVFKAKLGSSAVKALTGQGLTTELAKKMVEESLKHVAGEKTVELTVDAFAHLLTEELAHHLAPPEQHERTGAHRKGAQAHQHTQ